jgi:hypothetical protein
MTAFRCFGQAFAIAVSTVVVTVQASWAQGPVDDLRVSQLEQEVRDLKQLLRQQERRIELLESDLRRATLSPIAAPPGHAAGLSANANSAWLQSANWDKLRHGMSEAELTRVLGPPNSVRRSQQGDTQTLLYAVELEGGGFLSGRVVVTDQRVVEIHKPALK